MFEINMSGRGGMNPAALRQSRQKIFGIDDILVGAGISALGGWLGGRANRNAQRDAMRNANNVPAWTDPYGDINSYGTYTPTPYNMDEINGILSGNYQVDPALRRQMLEIAGSMKERGATDYAIQQALHKHWQERQAQARKYEKGLTGWIKEAVGIDENGNPVGGSFDPNSQASRSSFKYLAPELAGAMKDTAAQEQAIDAQGDLDPVAKARLKAELRRNYYGAATAAREGQRKEAMSMLSGLQQQANATSAAPMVGWDSQSGSLLGAVGGLDQGAMGLDLNQRQSLAGYMDARNRFNEDANRFGVSRGDELRSGISNRSLGAYGARLGAQQGIMANAGRPGDAIGSLAGTVASGYLASRAPSTGVQTLPATVKRTTGF